MSVPTITLSLLAGLLLSLGCSDRAEPDTCNGTLLISAPDTSHLPVARSLTVTGLDHPLHTRIALPRDPGARVPVPLPAGLYVLEWIGDPTIDADHGEPSTLALAPPKPEWVVIASGQVSAVQVRVRYNVTSAPPSDSAARASLAEAKLAAR